MKHIFFSILTALAFWHCQDAAPSPKNILNCYVRFDAAGQKVKAEASLLDAASKQAIELPGGIRFQSTEMKVLPVRGITYTVEFPAVYKAEQIFDWKNKKGERGELKIAVPVIDSFFFDSKVLSIKNPANLRWIGKPLAKGETLVFIWENTEEGKTVPMEVSTTLGAPLIEIPAAKVAQIGVGNWSLYLVRKRFAKAETTDFLVESMAEFYTRPIMVRVEG
ncbi:MAG: hypothetical protein H7246_02350 [Phycisphaerae bacterium]|nr:hypothetical protein [Saprospiraceae bacterium]